MTLFPAESMFTGKCIMSYIKEMRKYIGHAPMISAGATVVVLKDNKILLNLRSDTGTWGIPGGAMELGETLEELPPES